LRQEGDGGGLAEGEEGLRDVQREREGEMRWRIAPLVDMERSQVK